MGMTMPAPKPESPLLLRSKLSRAGKPTSSSVTLISASLLAERSRLRTPVLRPAGRTVRPDPEQSAVSADEHRHTRGGHEASAMAAAEGDIDPVILSRIEQISQMLSQTNQNLSLFERLLPATSASRTTAPDQNSVDEVAGLKDRVADLEISNQNSMKKVAELEWKLLETENRLQG